VITYNFKYKDFYQLKEFIEKKDISNNRNILLQIFTGICNTDYIEELVNSIKSLIPHIKIIGSTTSGEILKGLVYEQSTILSFSIFENTIIKTYAVEFNEDSYAMGKNLIKEFKEYNPKVAITFTDGLRTNGEDYLRSFQEYNRDLIVSGGLAGDNNQFKNTIVFNQNSIRDCGAVVAILINKDLIVHTKASFGWESIGKTMTITKADKNLVYEIDGIKAVDIYKKYLGKDVTKLLPKTGIEFPLMVKRGSLTIPRAVIAKGKNGALYFGGNLREGDIITFGYGNIEAILKYSDKIAQDNSLHNSETIFIYSCMARLNLMKDCIAQEITVLSQLSTVSGFFTYGEFFSNRDANKNEMLNQTMTILALSENSNNSDKSSNSSQVVKINHPKENLTLRALSTLIAETSKELEEKNRALQKRIEHEVQENITKDTLLRKQSKLAQMGQMLSVIAHQWRQPLSAISSTLLSIQIKLDNKKFNFDNKDEREEFLKLLEQKHNNVFSYLESLSETIEDFRNFFKPNRKKRYVALTEPIENALSILQTSIKNKNIDIDISYENNQEVYIYKNEMMHVILNILKNAIDNFAEKNIKSRKISIKTYKSSEKNIIEICDNGGGIDKDTLPNIFDLYFSTKNNKNGTGLGLYISKVIVQEHNKGKLSAINKDSGVCFKIVLP